MCTRRDLRRGLTAGRVGSGRVGSFVASHRASDGRGREASSLVESVGRSFGRRDETNVAREKSSWVVKGEKIDRFGFRFSRLRSGKG